MPQLRGQNGHVVQVSGGGEPVNGGMGRMKEKTYSNLLNKDWKPSLHALREALEEIAGQPTPVYRPIRVMSKVQYQWETRMERVYRWRYWMGKV